MRNYPKIRFTVKFVIYLLLVSSIIPFVRAEDKHPIDREMDAAIEKNSSTGGRIEAMSNALKKWDALMNRSYQTLKEGLDPEAVESLIESQRAWILWRDKELAFIGRFHSKLEGTMYVPMEAYRRMNLTRQRAMQLERMAEFVNERTL